MHSLDCDLAGCTNIDAGPDRGARVPAAHCSARARRNIECRSFSRRARSSNASSKPARYSSAVRGRCVSDWRVDLRIATGVFSSCAALARNSRCCVNARCSPASIEVMASVNGSSSMVSRASSGGSSFQLEGEIAVAPVGKFGERSKLRRRAQIENPPEMASKDNASDHDVDQYFGAPLVITR